MPTAQELLAQAKAQLAQIQQTKDAISAKGGFTEEGLTKATSSLKTANEKLSSSATKAGYTVPKSTQTQPQVTTPVTPQPAPQFSSPTERAGNYSNLSAALQNAINLGRAQRQSSELDFLGGVIPEGAVSAGTFTGLLANLNKASSNYATDLTDQVLEFARDEQDFVREQQNDIRDLALSYMQAGGKQEGVNAILASSDIDTAISVAAGALGSLKSKETIEKVGSNLVAYDQDGNARVIFSAESGTTGGATVSKTTTPGSQTPPVNSGVDVSGGFDYMQETDKNVREKAKQTFAPDFANRVITELTGEELRLFLNDFAETQNQRGQSIDPEAYYLQWKQAAGLEKEGKEAGTSKRTP